MLAQVRFVNKRRITWWVVALRQVVDVVSQRERCALVILRGMS
jgi:hypothetical protein